MRVLSLHLPRYKNLVDFRITFAAAAPDVLIVGDNGTGKSNLIEALVTIFRDLIEQSPRKRIETPFAYHLRYEIGGKIVDITHSPAAASRRTLIKVDEAIRQLTQLADPKSQLLPRTVFAYYSGPSDRLSRLFDASLLRFRDAMIAGDKRAHERLIYGRLIHSRFVLLAFLIEDDANALAVLRNELGIEDLESALFVTQQPYWYKGRIKPSEKEEIWGAKGVVREFLDQIYAKSLAPLLLDVHERTGVGTRARRQRLHLLVRQADVIRDIVDALRPKDEPRSRTLFRLLESAFVSDLIHDISVTVRKTSVAEGIGFRELSEGEQQLLMVLGLLRFTRDEESLFFLDEPDTHLNPIWGMKFLDLIGKVVGQDDSRHLLLVTHDPVAVAAASRDQVRLLTREENGHIYANPPIDDPEMLGVPGVLTSELFNLSSVVSPDIEGKMEERRNLIALDDQRTPAQDSELDRLSKRLAPVDLSATMPDPLYAEFLKALTAREEDLIKHEGELDADQLARRQKVMDEILAEILNEPGPDAE